MKIKKIKPIAVFSILLSIILTTGCIDLNEFFNGSSDENDGTVTYEKTPTKISYTLSYGYSVAASGSGDYSIKYSIDTPEVLHENGYVNINEIFNNNYENETLATYNTVKKWNITSSSPGSYNLGLKAYVKSETYMLSDLTGTNALTVNQIKNQHPDIVDQYTKSQSNDTVVFIDPNNSEVESISKQILSQTDSDNSFHIAKNLFIWLKQETSYEKHAGFSNVQTCTQTLDSLKGDCDDLSFLYISLLRSACIPARFIRGFLIKYDNGMASLEPHAWVELFVGGNVGNNGWIPVECACSSDDMNLQVYQNFGLESADHLRLFTDDGSNNSLNISLTGIRIRYSESFTVVPSSYSNLHSYQTIESKNLQIKDNYRSYV